MFGGDKNYFIINHVRNNNSETVFRVYRFHVYKTVKTFVKSVVKT
jgi:hypothetical protein